MERRPKRSDVCEAEILEACRRFHARLGPTPDIALADRFPRKVILAKMDQMVDKGLLEYGVSLRTAWVVGDPPHAADHAALLAMLRGFGMR